MGTLTDTALIRNRGLVVNDLSLISTPGELSPNWRYRPKAGGGRIGLVAGKLPFAACSRPYSSHCAKDR